MREYLKDVTNAYCLVHFACCRNILKDNHRIKAKLTKKIEKKKAKKLRDNIKKIQEKLNKKIEEGLRRKLGKKLKKLENKLKDHEEKLKNLEETHFYKRKEDNTSTSG